MEILNVQLQPRTQEVGDPIPLPFTDHEGVLEQYSNVVSDCPVIHSQLIRKLMHIARALRELAENLRASFSASGASQHVPKDAVEFLVIWQPTRGRSLAILFVSSP